MGNPAARESSFQSPPARVTVADVMQIPPTTVDRNDHAAAAAYLMKPAAATVLMVLDTQTDQPVGIITEADIAHAVADEKDVNRVRINNLMTRRRQEVCTRCGAGLYRRARKIRRTVAALIRWPSRHSSPWTLRYPQAGSPVPAAAPGRGCPGWSAGGRAGSDTSIFV